VARAAVGRRNLLHDLVDVLPTSSPGGLSAGLAGDGSTHRILLGSFGAEKSIPPRVSSRTLARLLGTAAGTLRTADRGDERLAKSASRGKVREGLRCLRQRPAGRNQGVEIELAAHVEVDEPGDVSLRNDRSIIRPEDALVCLGKS